jgi:hypothetical protein
MHERSNGFSEFPVADPVGLPGRALEETPQSL